VLPIHVGTLDNVTLQNFDIYDIIYDVYRTPQFRRTYPYALCLER